MIRQKSLTAEPATRTLGANRHHSEKLRVLLVSPDPLPLRGQLEALSFETMAVWGDQSEVKNMLRLHRPHLILVDMMGTPGEQLTQWLRRSCDQPVMCCLNADQAQKALEAKAPESLNFVVQPIRAWDLKINIELAMMFDMAQSAKLTLDTARRCARQPYEPIITPRIGSPRLSAVASAC